MDGPIRPGPRSQDLSHKFQHMDSSYSPFSHPAALSSAALLHMHVPFILSPLPTMSASSTTAPTPAQELATLVSQATSLAKIALDMSKLVMEINGTPIYSQHNLYFSLTTLFQTRSRGSLLHRWMPLWRPFNVSNLLFHKITSANQVLYQPLHLNSSAALRAPQLRWRRLSLRALVNTSPGTLSS